VGWVGSGEEKMDPRPSLVPVVPDIAILPSSTLVDLAVI